MLEHGICPYGGQCIDPGNPSDCLVNSHCVNFKSEDERIAYDKLPFLFLLRKDGIAMYFKNKNQLRFFLIDHSHWYTAEFFLIVGEEEIPYLLDLFMDL